MCVCMCVCGGVCVSVCVCMCACVHIYTHTITALSGITQLLDILIQAIRSYTFGYIYKYA